MAFTDEQKERYIRLGGAFCPYCGGNDIEGGTIEAESISAWSLITCNCCGREWRDVFSLTEIEEVTTD